MSDMAKMMYWDLGAISITIVEYFRIVECPLAPLTLGRAPAWMRVFVSEFTGKVNFIA